MIAPEDPAVCAQCGQQTLLSAYAWNGTGWHAFQVCFTCHRFVTFTLQGDAVPPVS